MTRVDRTTVLRRLAIITRNAVRLAPYTTLTFDDYRADWVRQSAIERLLQASLEATLDICKHLLRARGIPRPKDAFEVIIAMGASGILPVPLARALAPATALRNRLVHEHEYDDLDDVQVHASIAKSARLLPQFAAAIGRYLDDPAR